MPISIAIDNQTVELNPNQTVLDGAKKLGISIPTMCYHHESKYFTSCMMCLVMDKKTGKPLPSCSVQAQPGMDIDTHSEEVFRARRDTLDLLLSEHVGDCEAPCQRICPGHMNIPLMIRHFQQDKFAAAIQTVRAEIPFPATICRLCPAPCEGGCRRGKYDSPISIRNLSVHTGDLTIKNHHPWKPTPKPPTGKKIAVVGGGASGLTAAYYLRLDGHAVDVFEKEKTIGGSLISSGAEGSPSVPEPACAERSRSIEGEGSPSVPERSVALSLSKCRGEGSSGAEGSKESEGKTLESIFSAEAKVLELLGVDIHLGFSLGGNLALRELTDKYQAICLTVGKVKPQDLDVPGLEVAKTGIKVESKTNQTSIPGVFAAGTCVKPSRMPIQSALAAKNMRISVNQYLKGQPVVGPHHRFNSAMGKLFAGEVDLFAESVSKENRVPSAQGDFKGYAPAEAKEESFRCLHCDCRKNESCQLRENSTTYEAVQSKFRGGGRRPFVQYRQESGVVFEPGKCLKCGVCVRIAKQEGEDLGLTFIGRGFDVKVGVPLDGTLTEGLKRAAAKTVANCPTGALSFFEHDDKNHF